MSSELLYEPQALPVPASLLGESPFWHPTESALYWCDIAGKRLNRFAPKTGQAASWQFDQEPGCCAPMLDGALLLAMRDGLWRFDPNRGERRLLASAPYDQRLERFNDGKADPRGRLWVGTIYEPRDPPLAALYCWADGELERVASGITVSNGLAFSPDGLRMYWTDTKAHTVYCFEVDSATGGLSNRQVFKTFSVKRPQQGLTEYGGRPDGAAVDTEGCYWVAMYEGQRLLRIAPNGEILREVKLPARCPTMPCFGGDDLRTLFVTTVSENRPPAELAEQVLAGRVLALRVEVPGLPVNFVR